MNTIKLFRLFLLLSMLFVSQLAPAMQKTALVIGNSAYSTSPLANPANDARAMGTALRNLGFEVNQFIDLNLAGMDKAIRKFGKKLKKNRGLGLFFYAGHGMQIDGNNYLIPIGSGITAADEVSYKSINAEMILKKMESAGNGFNIVIMDACRNNPFPSQFRSTAKGLARMDAPTGSIIAYATSPGSTAADGVMGENGLYTSHLLKAMKQRGLSVEEVFKQVRIGVLGGSDGKQTPWESSSLTGHFEFLETKPDSNNIQGDIPPPPPVYTTTQTSHLQVISNITGATVYINNVKRGMISKSHVLYVQNLTDKAVKVRLEQPGYPSQTSTVALQKGEWQQAYFEFLPEQHLATLKTNSAPLEKKDQNISIPVEISSPATEVEISKNGKNTKKSPDKANISDFFKSKSSGIESTEISTSGRFKLQQNSNKSP